MRPAPPRGVWALIAVGLLTLGSSAILIRLAGPVSPLSIAAWRTALVAVLVLPVALGRSRGALRRLSARDRWGIAGAGVLLGIHFVAWIASVQLTSVAAASVLVTTSPLFIVGIDGVVFRRWPRRAVAVAVALGVVGAALIGGASRAGGLGPAPLAGGALAVLAALCFAAYLVVGASVRQRAGATLYFGLVSGVAALTALVVAAGSGAPLRPTPDVALWVTAMALGPGLLGHGTFVVALRYVPASVIGVLSLAEPVVATILAVLLFSEVPAPVALVGMGLVLASIATVARTKPAATPPAD